MEYIYIAYFYNYILDKLNYYIFKFINKKIIYIYIFFFNKENFIILLNNELIEC